MPDLEEEEEISQDNSFMKRLLMDEFQDEDFIPSTKITTTPTVPPLKKEKSQASPPITSYGKQMCKYGLQCYRKVINTLKRLL